VADDFDIDEDETCRRFVLPALKEAANWPDERIKREFRINNGRIRATSYIGLLVSCTAYSSNYRQL
jgi:hypothetical protein